MKGLYIHIPFCIKKCKYCDFNSFSFTRDDKIKYLDALFCEMEQFKNERIDTIFIGGGTPTSLESYELGNLLDKIFENFTVDENYEFTIEANPKTVNKEKLNLLLEKGVNRISVGVQSFVDTELSVLGRIHTANDAKETLSLARECGFNNISIDLMSAIPNQTMESLKYSIDTALSLNPEHISCYSLILEDGTPLYDEFKKGLLTLPDEDTERKMYEYICKRLGENGYFQYEISNFSKKGYESEHNKKYWKCDEYIGLGLSAHSFAGGVRSANTDVFSEYLNGSFKKNSELLSQNDMMSEFMFLGFRMTNGVSEHDFFERFGVEMLDVFEKPLSKFIKLGMIVKDGEFYRLSHNAISISNQIMCEFLL